MDSEQLISLIFERKSLWDQRSKSYHNRDMSRKLWAEIAEEMNLPSSILKGKWKSMRDIYRRECQKCYSKMNSSSGREDNVSSSWPLFNSLKFLTGHIVPRKSQGNIPAPTSSEAVDPDWSEDNMSTATDDIGSEVNVGSNEPAISQSATSKLPKQQAKRGIAKKREREVHSELIDIEHAKLKFFQESESNENKEHGDYDYHFLMGLLPHLRKVRSDRKLSVQLKLQQVLENELSMYINT